jgi:hypothetical protein
VKVGGTPVGAACTPVVAVRTFFMATDFLAMALRFFFAVFLLADFIFRVRIAFFCIELRFVGMGIFLSTSNIWYRPYNPYFRGVQVVRLRRRQQFL